MFRSVAGVRVRPRKSSGEAAPVEGQVGHVRDRHRRQRDRAGERVVVGLLRHDVRAEAGRALQFAASAADGCRQEKPRAADEGRRLHQGRSLLVRGRYQYPNLDARRSFDRSCRVSGIQTSLTGNLSLFAGGLVAAPLALNNLDRWPIARAALTSTVRSTSRSPIGVRSAPPTSTCASAPRAGTSVAASRSRRTTRSTRRRRAPDHQIAAAARGALHLVLHLPALHLAAASGN